MGRSPQEYLAHFQLVKTFALHQMSPENPVTFQKRAGGGKTTLQDG